MLFLSLILMLLQEAIPLKPLQEIDIMTNYELRKKPYVENANVVFDQPDKESGTDLLPFMSINLKVKKWAEGITQIKVSDNKGKTYLKKKPTEEGLYDFELGFVDDIKDKVLPGKFFISFLMDKKPIEQITIEIEEDGTFLVNGEKRGKF